MMNSIVKGAASQCKSYAGLTRVSRRPTVLLDARIKSAHDGAPANAAGSKRLILSTRRRQGLGVWKVKDLKIRSPRSLAEFE